MMRPVSVDCKSEDVLIYADQMYRPWLKREWKPGGRLINFCMLNPSTARKDVNDPTVWGNEVRARRWGYGGMIITNLSDWRATDPRKMKQSIAPVSGENYKYIVQAAEMSEVVVCAWGKDGNYEPWGNGVSMAEAVLGGPLAPYRLHALKLNKDGTPAHPLYLGYELEPFLWREREVTWIS